MAKKKKDKEKTTTVKFKIIEEIRKARISPEQMKSELGQVSEFRKKRKAQVKLATLKRKIKEAHPIRRIRAGLKKKIRKFGKETAKFKRITKKQPRGIISISRSTVEPQPHVSRFFKAEEVKNQNFLFN